MKKIEHSTAYRFLAAVIGIVLCFETNVPAKWSFGVMGDNQQNGEPRYTASAITAIQAQFIAKQVKFVVQVGDQMNAGGNLTDRAALAQQLYDAGIGYFPLRGNHEAWTESNISLFQSNYPQTQGLSNTFGTINFSSPVLAGDFPDDLKGLSYSFDYSEHHCSARFLIIDTWFTPNQRAVVPGLEGYPSGYSVGDQHEWINSRLDKAMRGTEHAFVFAHQNLIPEYHWDCFFSGYSDANPDMQNLFFRTLSINDIKFFTSGHEHVYNRSVITSPDGNYHLQDINCVSGGAKFLDPKPVASANFKGQKVRQMQIVQERNNIGFYIYTVDGQRLTVDYYSDSIGGFLNEPYFPADPVFNFVKKESFGYDLNGKEFVVPQGGSYNIIADNFEGTTARILNGTNDCTMMDFEKRPLNKIVTTGWGDADNDRHCRRGDNDRHFRSNIFTLGGMADFGTEETDIFALEITYRQGKTRHIGEGCFGIGSPDAGGDWVNAVDKNFGGTKQFVKGSWKAEYGLGTYGIDPSAKTVWAVLNHAGDFAAVNDIEGKPGCNGHDDDDHHCSNDHQNR